MIMKNKQDILEELNRLSPTPKMMKENDITVVETAKHFNIPPKTARAWLKKQVSDGHLIEEVVIDPESSRRMKVFRAVEEK